jgi:dimethylhistidine N-methyltransferase
MVQFSRSLRQDGIDQIGLVDPHVADGHGGRDGHDGPRLTVQRVDTPSQRRRELVDGLCAEPARIAPKFFYDAQGSALYEAICRLDEYYPPRTEAAIFERHQGAIAAALPQGAQWVDLGCGDGAKAMRWLQPLKARRYLGVDIAESWLRDTLQRGAKRFPQVVFEGVVTDFTRGLDLHAQLDPQLPRVFFYPGSSIGNFDPAQAVQLLRAVRAHLRGADRLFIGVDAPKPLTELLPAYDDALGVTAAFNLNVLRVVNHELGSDFRPQDFLHRAVFNEPHSRIEMHLVARHDCRVQLAEGRQRAFRAGEAIVTEHSYKHTPERFSALLAEAGYGELRHFSDDHGGYGVYVAAPGGQVQ